MKMDGTEKGIIRIAVSIALAFCWALSSAYDYEEEVSQAEQYCDMVQRYKETAGREGWPDYKSTYSELCDD